jgi:hypothetical protein
MTTAQKKYRASLAKFLQIKFQIKNIIMGTLLRRALIFAAPMILGYVMKKFQGKKQSSARPRI